MRNKLHFVVEVEHLFFTICMFLSQDFYHLAYCCVGLGLDCYLCAAVEDEVETSAEISLYFYTHFFVSSVDLLYCLYYAGNIREISQ